MPFVSRCYDHKFDTIEKKIKFNMEVNKEQKIPESRAKTRNWVKQKW
jgi:hypothetical protein